jgi:tetratricopeptide (TPR) repeat protein
VLLGANPLEDIRNTASILGVMSQGRWYDRDELERRREGMAARYPEMKRFVDRFDALLQQSKAAEAVALYRSEAMGFEPNTLVRYDLMWSHGMRMLTENAANALPFVELAAELFPDECSLRNNLAEAHLRVGNREAALRALDAARRLCPEDATSQHLRDELK